MKTFTFLFTIIFVIAFPACTFKGLTKKSTDSSIINYVSKNEALVKEAAEFAVLVTYDTTVREFLAVNVPDKTMRNKISSLGTNVRVYYNNKSYHEIPDSNVTFSTITLAGKTEIIYDFAANKKELADVTNNRRQYLFIKLADRIYYRRTPIPMM